MRTGLRIMLAALCAGLLAGCETPPPGKVVKLCFDAFVAKKYEQALLYCGPEVHQFYSNNLWLATVHSQTAKRTTYAITADETTSLTTALVTVSLHFDLGDTSAVDWLLRLEMARRNRWYVDGVAFLNPDGTLRGNALTIIPDLAY